MVGTITKNLMVLRLKKLKKEVLEIKFTMQNG